MPRRKSGKSGRHSTTKPIAAVVKIPFEDDRPTEIHQRERKVSLAHSRQQLIVGSTIREMMSNRGHRLSDALNKLVTCAQKDLPRAVVDSRATLMLHHDFEFDRRVGYRLKLKLFDEDDGCVEVVAEVDQDGKAIRRGSMVSKLINI
jgi:hypothetical protein